MTYEPAAFTVYHDTSSCFVGGYGSFLLAIYDAEAEEFQSISKIGTGFSEELLKELSDQLKEHVIPQAPRYYRLLLPTCQTSLSVWRLCHVYYILES